MVANVRGRRCSAVPRRRGGVETRGFRHVCHDRARARPRLDVGERVTSAPMPTIPKREVARRIGLFAVVVAGCGGGATASLDSPTGVPPLVTAVAAVATSPASTPPSPSSSGSASSVASVVSSAPSSSLTPGDRLASRAMQGAPFYLLHDDAGRLECRRWSFVEGQLAGEGVYAKVREVAELPTRVSREVRIDARASVARIARVGSASMSRYRVSSEPEGLALWVDAERRERYMFFYGLDACRGAAQREGIRRGAPRGSELGKYPIDRPGPPGAP